MTTVTALTTSPISTYSGSAANRSQDQATFNTNVQYLAGYIPGIPGEVNAFVTDLNSRITEINTVAGEVNTDASNASDSATAAANSANVANYQGAYAGGTTYALGETVSYSGLYWVSLQGSNTGNTPAGGSAYWSPILLLGVPRVALGAGVDIDLGLGLAQHECSMSGNKTFTFSNIPASNRNLFYLRIAYTSGTLAFSGVTVAWADAINGGSQPTLTAGKDYIFLGAIDGGGTVLEFIGVAVIA